MTGPGACESEGKENLENASQVSGLSKWINGGAIPQEEEQGGNYRADVPQLLMPASSRAWEPQLLSPCAATTEAHVPKARAPQQENSMQWEAHGLQQKSSPLSPQPEKACVQQWRPNTAKKKKKIQVSHMDFQSADYKPVRHTDIFLRQPLKKEDLFSQQLPRKSN